jgi:signal transduction histidine kinase
MTRLVMAGGRGPRRRERAKRSAREQVTRLLYAVNGVAALTFCLLAVPVFSAQVWFGAAPVASVVAWAFMFGLPLALGVFAPAGSLRFLHGLAVAGAVVFIAIMAAWLIFYPLPLPVGADQPWVLMLNGGPAAALAISVRGRTALAFVVLVSVLGGVLRVVTGSGENPLLVGVQNGLQALLLLSVFVGLTIAFLHSAARVDTADRLARAVSTGRAELEARTHERLTMNALVHDSVLATLLIAGAGRVPTSVVAAQARSTLAELDALRDPGLDAMVTGDEAVRQLTALVAELAPDAVLRTQRGPADQTHPGHPSSSPTDTQLVPQSALTALLGSVGEALRNSTNSAGSTAGGRALSPVFRTVFLQLSSAGMHVDVHDDGRGFDTATVRHGRLGISQSIVGRMERLDGGTADVTSSPGAGTQVAISWTRP